jgi:hypothetical protein
MDKAMSKPVQTNSPQSPAEPTPMKRGQSAQAQRDKRSKEALKANMARRKAQVRARGAPEEHGDQDTTTAISENGQETE